MPSPQTKQTTAMPISQDLDPFSYSIKAYKPSQITLNVPVDPKMALESRNNPALEAPKIKQKILQRSFIVGATQLIEDWSPQSIDTLSEADFALIATMNPEVVILGTGPKLCWPNRALFKPLIERNIGVEVMDNSAACRTFNILSYEGRMVVAGLLIK